MMLPNGLFGNDQGRRPQPGPTSLPTTGQAKAVRKWATANLPAYATAELRRGLGLVSAHPDARSAGYSLAKQARQRLEAELATRSDTP